MFPSGYKHFCDIHVEQDHVHNTQKVLKVGLVAVYNHQKSSLSHQEQFTTIPAVQVHTADSLCHASSSFQHLPLPWFTCIYNITFYLYICKYSHLSLMYTTLYNKVIHLINWHWIRDLAIYPSGTDFFFLCENKNNASLQNGCITKGQQCSHIEQQKPAPTSLDPQKHVVALVQVQHRLHAGKTYLV